MHRSHTTVATRCIVRRAACVNAHGDARSAICAVGAHRTLRIRGSRAAVVTCSVHCAVACVAADGRRSRRHGWRGRQWRRSRRHGWRWLHGKPRSAIETVCSQYALVEIHPRTTVVTVVVRCPITCLHACRSMRCCRRANEECQHQHDNRAHAKSSASGPDLATGRLGVRSGVARRHDSWPRFRFGVVSVERLHATNWSPNSHDAWRQPFELYSRTQYGSTTKESQSLGSSRLKTRMEVGSGEVISATISRVEPRVQRRDLCVQGGHSGRKLRQYY